VDNGTTNKTTQQSETSTHTITAIPARPTLTIDYALYEHYLESSGMTEDQKRDFLDALWFIVVSFVDLGVGVHPLQQVDEACEQNQIPAEYATPDSGDVLSCINKSISQSENHMDVVCAPSDGRSRS